MPASVYLCMPQSVWCTRDIQQLLGLGSWQRLTDDDLVRAEGHLRDEDAGNGAGHAAAGVAQHVDRAGLDAERLLGQDAAVHAAVQTGQVSPSHALKRRATRTSRGWQSARGPSARRCAPVTSTQGEQQEAGGLASRTHSFGVGRDEGQRVRALERRVLARHKGAWSRKGQGERRSGKQRGGEEEAHYDKDGYEGGGVV